MLRTTRLVRYSAVSAFLIIAVAPVVLLGVTWLAPALRGNPQVLGWALPSQRALLLLGKSSALALAVAVIATVLGAGLAISMNGDGRWREFLRGAYLIPFFIPPYIHVLAWMAIAGRRQLLAQLLARIVGGEGPTLPSRGFWPAALVLTFATFPVIALLVRSCLEAMGPELLEAASLLKAPWPVACRIVAPLVMPSIKAGAGLVFGLVLIEYAVPSMFEHNVYVTEIYASFSQDFNAQKAFATSLPLMLLAAFILVLSQRSLRNNPLGSPAGSPVRLATSAWPLPIRALLLLSVGIWGISSLAPILVLMSRRGMLSVAIAALASAGPEIMLTIIVATVCAITIVMVALPLAITLTGPSRRWKLGWLTCALPLAVPSPVIGIALIYLWNQRWLAWGYGTLLMLVIAHAARFLPFGVYAAASRVRNIDPLLTEAQALSDVSWWRRFLWVILPMSTPAITITLLVVFVLSLGELGASLLIAPPGEATLPMRIYNLLHYGATDTVAVLSLVILLVSSVTCAAVLGIQKWLWGPRV